jgi:copper chaperone CopZ
MNAITYEVPEMSCRHCVEAISEELALVAGYEAR